MNGGSDGNDHAAARLELLHKRRRDVARSRGDDDGVEGRVFGPAVIAIALPHRHVVEAQRLNRSAARLGQRLDDLDRVDALLTSGESTAA